MYLAIGILANVLYCFLIVSCISQRVTNIIRKRRLLIAALIFQTALYASWVVLCDAFRRFRNVKESEQVISNVKVSAMVLTYLFFAIGETVLVVA